jgi:hypothetical protein
LSLPSLYLKPKTIARIIWATARQDLTPFPFDTDQQFDALVKKHAGFLEKITIVSRDENKRKSTPGLPGMRLTPKGRQIIEKAVQNT